MQNTTLLQFRSLESLAKYIKAVHPSAYIINTLKLTVMAEFSDFEIAIALDDYNGTVVVKKDEPVSV